MFQDKTLKCRDCGEDFVFTASEQQFYAEKGFVNEPSRCPACRANRRHQARNGNRQMYEVVCSQCGKNTTVPFNPTGEKPVYCRDCFASRRN